MSRLLRSLLFLWLAAVVVPVLPAEEPPLDPKQLAFFEKRIRPLLVTHCYECHSAKAEELQGGLLLDSKAGWVQGGDSGTAIVPGDVDGSLLIQAVRYDEYEMPPKGKLPAADVEAFEKWVKMGAPDPRTDTASLSRPATAAEIDFDAARQFWAFQPPTRHQPPPVHSRDWPSGRIDRFILARLEAEKLQPAPDADRRTWMRRVTFDLIGLPPTVAELAACEQDDSPDAAVKVVDRLLASPHFGEHWGRHWLDVARYADSNGNDFNATYFNAWRYRDYVIRAFNDDQPFDQFIREQLAGDLLPYDNEQQRAEQLIATGFLMVGPKMLSERDKVKLRLDVADEQVDTTGRAFLALTLGCSRCHDHKFDPIPTADYYALAGIFHSTESLFGESQQYVSAWRESDLPIAPAHASALAVFHEQQSKLKSDLEQAKKDLKVAQKTPAAGAAKLAGILVDDTDAKVVGIWKASTFSPKYIGEGYIHDNKTDKGQKSICFVPDIPKAGHYEVRISFASSKGRDKNVPVTIQHAEGETQLKLDQEETPPIDGLLKPLGRFRFEAGTAGSVTISTEGTVDYVVADAAQFVPLDESPSGPAADADAQGDKNPLESATQRVKALEGQLKQLEAQAPPPAPQAMAVREHKEIGDCQICIRGEPHKRGPSVPRGFLRVAAADFQPQFDDQQSGRVPLANWVASPNNPLTGRVIVNRVWQHLLGEGIVRSVDNFGHQGERPSHPELLDTMTVDFLRPSDLPGATSATSPAWTIKKLIRDITLSRVYGLSSLHDDHTFRADPENRLLWRAQRRRLPAESVRDAMLAISDQLDSAPGGNPVAGLGKLAVDNSKQEGASVTQGEVQRSVYLPIVRNTLPEFLTVFDFADPDVVTGRRTLTNVPAQALLLMNSPFVRRCASLTAQSELVPGDSIDSLLADQLYLRVLGRRPNDAERQRALDFVRLSDVESTAAPDRAAEAWVNLCQVLFASTEFRFVD